MHHNEITIGMYIFDKEFIKISIKLINKLFTLLYIYK